jgi:hypothetical protein
MQRILASLLILILAACGGGPTPPPPPTFAPPTPTPESDSDASTLTSAEPLAVDVSGLEAGTFTASGSGKYSFTISGPAVVAVLSNGGYSLSMTAEGSALVFLLPADIEPGSYEITMSFSDAQANGGLAANYTHLADEESETYGTVTSGRITLESVSPFTGAFEVVFDADGETITASGAFNQAMLLSTGA